MTKFEFRDENEDDVLSLWMTKMVDEYGVQHIRLMSKVINKPNAQEYVEAIIDEDNKVTPIAAGNLKFTDSFDVLYKCSRCSSPCNYGYNFVSDNDIVQNYAPPVNCICNRSIKPEWERLY